MRGGVFKNIHMRHHRQPRKHRGLEDWEMEAWTAFCSHLQPDKCLSRYTDRMWVWGL